MILPAPFRKVFNLLSWATSGIIHSNLVGTFNPVFLKINLAKIKLQTLKINVSFTSMLTMAPE
jgi:hypothetical protein